MEELTVSWAGRKEMMGDGGGGGGGGGEGGCTERVMKENLSCGDGDFSYSLFPGSRVKYAQT